MLVGRLSQEVRRGQGVRLTGAVRHARLRAAPLHTSAIPAWFGHHMADTFFLALAALLLFLDLALIGFTYVQEANGGLRRLQALDIVTSVLLAGLILVGRQARVTKERRRSAALLRAATTDELTGLANRRALTEAVESELSRSVRHGRRFALALWDLNAFKALNDAQGHLAGDRALRQFARVLTACTRSSDLAARLGGDEFAVLLREAGLHDARLLNERLQRELLGGQAGSLTASFGAAEFPEDGAAYNELFSRADRRMYFDKLAWRAS